jgi:hypothetical protein
VVNEAADSGDRNPSKTGDIPDGWIMGFRGHLFVTAYIIALIKNNVK